jgi:hypothetical protein
MQLVPITTKIMCSNPSRLAYSIPLMTLEVRHAYVICVEWLKHTYLVPVVSVVVENGDIITWYT